MASRYAFPSLATFMPLHSIKSGGHGNTVDQETSEKSDSAARGGTVHTVSIVLELLST